MVNYQNGKIYKIVSDQTDKIYIGSTTDKYLSHRLNNHRYEYKSKRSNVSSKKILKYDDVKIILIETYPCKNKDELFAREQYHVDKNKDICVNKLKAIHPNKKIREQNKSSSKKYRSNHSEDKLCIYCDEEVKEYKFKQHECSKQHQDNFKFFESILNSETK